jgi:hypothetical protein
MKTITIQEVKEEISELYGANKALGIAMDALHAQRMEITKHLFTLNQMLKDMENDDSKGD